MSRVEEIKKLAREVGLTQAELARRAGLSKSHVSEGLRGLRPMSDAALDRLRRALGLESEDRE